MELLGILLALLLGRVRSSSYDIVDDPYSNAANLDRFNYRETVKTDAYNDYGPEDWINVRCDNVQQCLGWPDSYKEGVGWVLEENTCEFCPANGNTCGAHRQSPINLERNVAMNDTANYNFCIDIHWMSYFDSSCTFEELKRLNAFSIHRHALKITQPVEDLGDDTYQIACSDGQGRRWGRIDFSKGFSQWWHLSHIDFHVPSEHTQEGKRYAGEIQMHHFYSVSGEEAGVNNQMATVSMFLEAYDSTPDYDVLNKIICQWRKNEDETRAACGLPSVTTEYPGCYFYRRDHSSEANTTTAKRGRLLRELQNQPQSRPAPISAHDIILHNSKQLRNNATYSPKVILMTPEDHGPDPDFDWDAFIAAQYEQEEKSQADNRHRKLINYDHVGPWFNYFPMIGCKTEYYFRYSGTQTVPPCYGPVIQGANRAGTNNWRVMKDPILVSHRQINEMHRLLKERIAPIDDPLKSCKPDTAAKPDPVDANKVNVSRPLMATHRAHSVVFCECLNWMSKWKEEQNWCRTYRTQQQRFYQHPYNFMTDGY